MRFYLLHELCPMLLGQILSFGFLLDQRSLMRSDERDRGAAVSVDGLEPGNQELEEGGHHFFTSNDEVGVPLVLEKESDAVPTVEWGVIH